MVKIKEDTEVLAHAFIMQISKDYRLCGRPDNLYRFVFILL